MYLLSSIELAALKALRISPDSTFHTDAYTSGMYLNSMRVSTVTVDLLCEAGFCETNGLGYRLTQEGRTALISFESAEE